MLNILVLGKQLSEMQRLVYGDWDLLSESKGNKGIGNH